MKSILALFATVFLAGCSAKYSTNNIQNTSEMLLKDLPVAIARSVNGTYETISYAGSGEATSAAVKAAFLRHTDTVNIYPDCEDVDCLKSKHPISRGYYVVPNILHWEDRATEWSGIPDRIEIKITVYNAETSHRVASTIISGKSK